MSHNPCPNCSSSDAFKHYEDGWGYCFSCSSSIPLSDDAKIVVKRNPVSSEFMRGTYEDLPARKLFADTLKKFKYQVNVDDGCHIAPFFNSDGEMVAQKIRRRDKKFAVIGDLNNDAGLFGQQLWKPGKGERWNTRLVVTEGEIDALSYAQVTGLKWPVVSIPNGASGAVKAIRKNLEFVEAFDEVVFLFDNDEPGMEAAKECAALLQPGLAKIAHLPLKDANEMLVANRVKELQQAVYDARPFRPDGIVTGKELSIKRIKKQAPRGYSLPYPELSEKIRGLRKHELVTITAGSGVGKTTLARELHYSLINDHGLRVGGLYLEESAEKSAQSLIALDNNVPWIDLVENPDVIDDDAWQQSHDKLIAPNAFYDSYGSCDIDVIMAKMRYLAVGLQCDFIILDHVSMVVSGLTSKEGDRKLLDILMTALGQFAENKTNDVGVIAVSHVNRADGGKSFNEGGQISLSNLRGSAAIEQLSHIVIADERDQQDEDNPDLHYLRILKNRPIGITGKAGNALFNTKTGRLNPCDAPETRSDFDDNDPDVEVNF